MLAAFTKALDQLIADDVQAMIGWPELLIVEFKEDLPERDGRKDGGHTGGNVGEHAKAALFKEIVAFANTAGGHVVLGVAETRDRRRCSNCSRAAMR